MNKLVRNLLTLNQLESGRDEMTVERFDIVSRDPWCPAVYGYHDPAKRSESKLQCMISRFMYGQMNSRLKKL